MSSDRQPWPMGYPKRAGQPMHDPFDTMVTDLELISADEQTYWRVQTLDRHDGGSPQPMRLTQMLAMAEEFCVRFGVDAAARFIAETADPPAASADCEFLDERTSLTLRFGPQGPHVFAGCLSLKLAIEGRFGSGEAA